MSDTKCIFRKKVFSTDELVSVYIRCWWQTWFSCTLGNDRGVGSKNFFLDYCLRCLKICGLVQFRWNFGLENDLKHQNGVSKITYFAKMAKNCHISQLSMAIEGSILRVQTRTIVFPCQIALIMLGSELFSSERVCSSVFGKYRLNLTLIHHFWSQMAIFWTKMSNFDPKLTKLWDNWS